MMLTATSKAITVVTKTSREITHHTLHAEGIQNNEHDGEDEVEYFTQRGEKYGE